MRIRTGIAAVCVALVLTVRGCDDAPCRDLARYDLDGPYILDRSNRHAEDQPVYEAAIRKFLWTHWVARKRAHVAVVQYSLEGLGTRAWYFIEPDPQGVWHIVLEIDRMLPAVKADSSGEHLREQERHKVYAVERVAIEDRDSAVAKLLPEEDRRPEERYWLRLKDKSGGLISGL